MKKIISMILVVAMIATIGVQAFAKTTPWGDLTADMVVEALETQIEEEGTDYEVEVDKDLDEGFNIIMYVHGTEDVDYFYMHFTEDGGFVWTKIFYIDASTDIIYEED